MSLWFKHLPNLAKQSLDHDYGSDEEPTWLSSLRIPQNIISQSIPCFDEPYCDPKFPPENALGPDHYASSIIWKRPHQISSNPKLFVDGGSQFDVIQGDLGDCWFLCAAASLSLYPEYLRRIIKEEQSFDPHHPDYPYTGEFTFNFFQYGKWVEVKIDDRLPTKHNKLIFTKSADPNEFWSALLEKAYAKLNGSYSNLKGGIATEAMVDLTGGVVEYLVFDEDKKLTASRKNYRKLRQGYKNKSIMSCAIQASPYDIESERPDGLLKGHAYSITGVKKVKNQITRESHRLLKLRNPWGQCEYIGKFSDTDEASWENIRESDRTEKGEDNDDGEFHIEYKDWARIFTKLEFCRVDMTNPENIQGKFQEMTLEASWRESESSSKNTAGGSCVYDTFYDNPYLVVELLGGVTSDQVLISLQQKHRRKLKSEGLPMLDIGFDVYRMEGEGVDDESSHCKIGPHKNGKSHLEHLINKFCPIYRADYCRRRDLTKSLENLEAGKYVIVPSTYKPGQEGKFFMRVYVEQPDEEEEEEDSQEYHYDNHVIDGPVSESGSHYYSTYSPYV